MSISLDFLYHLSELCRQEYSKTKPKDGKTGLKDSLSLTENHPSSCHSTEDSSSVPDGVKVEKSEEYAQTDMQLPEVEIETKIETVDPILTPSASGVYSCEKCKYFTRQHSKYVSHTTTDAHLGLKRCSYCLEKVKSEELLDHYKSVHMDSKEFAYLQRLDNGAYHCTKCDVTFQYYSKYKIHLSTLLHNDMKTCKLCDTVFPAKEIEKHEQEFHAKIGKLFVCKVCGLKYKWPATLRRHMSTVHVKKDEFKCTQCERIFFRQDALLKHESSHSTAKIYACCFCVLTFKCKDNLLNHMTNIHCRNKYQCTTCYRSFDDEASRDFHVKTHQEGYRFICMVCGHQFRTNARRERHYKTHLNPKKRKSAKRKAKKEILSAEEESDYADMSYIEPMIDFDDSETEAGQRSFLQENQKPAESVRENNAVKGNVKDDPGNKKKKSKVQNNCENKSPHLPKAKRKKNCKSVLSEVSEQEANIKCNNTSTEDSPSDSKASQSMLSEIKKCDVGYLVGEKNKTSSCSKNLLSNLENTSPKLSNGERCDVSEKTLVRENTESVKLGKISLRKTSDLMNVQNQTYSNSSETKDSCGTDEGGLCERLTSEEVSELCPNQVYTLASLEPGASIPDDVVFVDVNNLGEIDSTITSFSSLHPDSTLQDSALVINVDNISQCETIDIKDIDKYSADIFPVDIQYIKLDVDNGVSLNIDEACRDEILALKRPDEAPAKTAKKVSNKKSVRKQSSRKAPKCKKKYADEGNKNVVAKNLCSNDDNFVLPEFLLEEESDE